MLGVARGDMQRDLHMPEIQHYVIFLLFMAGIEGSKPHSPNYIHVDSILSPVMPRKPPKHCADGSSGEIWIPHRFFDGEQSPSNDQKKVMMVPSCTHRTEGRSCGLLRSKILCLRGAGEMEEMKMEVDGDQSKHADVAQQRSSVHDTQQSDSSMFDTASQAGARQAEAAARYEQILQKSQVSMEDREHQESTRMVDEEENVEPAVYDPEGSGVSKNWNMLTALDTFGVNVTVFQLNIHPYTLVELWWDSMGMFRCSYEVRYCNMPGEYQCKRNVLAGSSVGQHGHAQCS